MRRPRRSSAGRSRQDGGLISSLFSPWLFFVLGGILLLVQLASLSDPADSVPSTERVVSRSVSSSFSSLDLVDSGFRLIEREKKQEKEEEEALDPSDYVRNEEDEEASPSSLSEQVLSPLSDSDFLSMFEVEESEVDQHKSSSPAPFAPVLGHNTSFYDGETLHLKPQIALPKQGRPIVKSVNAGQNFWPWYKILRQKHGWSHPTGGSFPDSRASMLISRGKVPFLRKGKQILNSIGVSGCIGGTKLLQLECRRRLAKHHGCLYEDLGIQPAQYSLESRESCEALLRASSRPENQAKLWLYKPSNTFHGVGIKLLHGAAEVEAHVQRCRTKKHAIMMEYVSKPATMMGGYKFDLRSYLLVASLDPQLVFFADGFVRKSDTVYDENDKRTTVHVTNSINQKKTNHFFSFEELGDELKREMGFPSDYLNRAREHMKMVSMYVFKTTDVQPKPPRKFPGRFHLFAIDWLIDSDGNLHLLEGNGYPLVTEYPVKGLTPKVWEDLLDLVLTIHIKPSKLSSKMTVKDKFQYGKWSLIFSELEEKYEGNPYSPCYLFPQKSLIF